MFFHIDETGNTGNDLFNRDQPKLGYGVISSRTNVDAIGIDLHRQMLQEIKAGELHAKDMRASGIIKVSNLLLHLQEKMNFDFDYYFIEKKTLAIVIFFDAIFDSELNPAVRWESYWTPMRFVIIHKLAHIMDEDLLRKSWSLCTDRNIEMRESDIIELLTAVKARALDSAFDHRSKEVIADACSYGITNPLALDFGYQDKKILSPNAVGFQFVVNSMARRIRGKGLKDASSIIVDQQKEFNKAQIETHRVLGLMNQGLRNCSPRDRMAMLNHPLYKNMGDAEILGIGHPTKEISVLDSKYSIGLQIVDIYLWIAQRMMTGQLPQELQKLAKKIFRRSMVDGISMDGMEQRFHKFMADIPSFADLSEEQLQAAAQLVDQHRIKVREMKLG
ncbi:hypothetical protein BRN01_15095 [Xanthomonas oryzae pv. oryzae]|uniref:DUF3800 domain-containing protein n=1 Tax=Xanthomonas oryzae TaxID=347 RepID=UPI0000678E51|nr:DUF3800 domain-containing protein [Xanthomonas oryzae]AXM20660.1 hypothetical protein BRM88_08860 [Xanthomonas oryzae pv. oryzae]PNR61118.1 hypothetical protein LA07_08245 [Xanthomonas oryzae pv. oryzae]RBB53196.1 hypothetical protein BRN60_20540 [Xanthomonas oryzae pv. oryzae]RBB95333.1 hypothetical protein BRN47_10305 [Xanthomonas oryzae pv. oryzae]RBC10261.1 hypothetical protein BRN29_14295 [Xanthomonas oryzae pv. oryzae]